MATRRNLTEQKEPRRAKRPAPPRPPIDDDLALAEELIREAHKDDDALIAMSKKFLKQLGIRGKPIGAKKLREMAIREGLDPASNEFSRGIIEMREE